MIFLNATTFLMMYVGNHNLLIISDIWCEYELNMEQNLSSHFFFLCPLCVSGLIINSSADILCAQQSSPAAIEQLPSSSRLCRKSWSGWPAWRGV